MVQEKTGYFKQESDCSGKNWMVSARVGQFKRHKLDSWRFLNETGRKETTMDDHLIEINKDQNVSKQQKKN